MAKPNFPVKVFVLSYPDGEEVKIRAYIAADVDEYVSVAEKTIRKLNKTISQLEAKLGGPYAKSSCDGKH